MIRENLVLAGTVILSFPLSAFSSLSVTENGFAFHAFFMRGIFFKKNPTPCHRHQDRLDTLLQA